MKFHTCNWLNQLVIAGCITLGQWQFNGVSAPQYGKGVVEVLSLVLCLPNEDDQTSKGAVGIRLEREIRLGDDIVRHADPEMFCYIDGKPAASYLCPYLQPYNEYDWRNAPFGLGGPA